MRAVNTDSTLFCAAANGFFVLSAGIFTRLFSGDFIFSACLYQFILSIFANGIWGRLVLLLGILSLLRSRIFKQNRDDERSWKISLKLTAPSLFLPPIAFGCLLWIFLDDRSYALILASFFATGISFVFAIFGILRPLSVSPLVREDCPLFDPPLFKRNPGENISSWEFLPSVLLRRLKSFKHICSKYSIGRGLFRFFKELFSSIGHPL